MVPDAVIGPCGAQRDAAGERKPHAALYPGAQVASADDRVAQGERPGIVEMQTRAWFNENLESRNFYVPGVIAIIVLLITLMLTSIFTRSQLLASQLAMVLTFLPSFLLSDFMYSVSNMPQAIQAITYLVPARYFVVLLKGIYLKGVGLEVLAPEAGLLAVFAVTMVLLANLKFKKKLG